MSSLVLQRELLLCAFCALCVLCGSFCCYFLIPNPRSFPENLFHGMRGAHSPRGTTRNRRNVDRVPAANTPLSAACRCASYLPSVPSVLSPRNVDPGQE